MVAVQPFRLMASPGVGNVPCHEDGDQQADAMGIFHKFSFVVELKNGNSRRNGVTNKQRQNLETIPVSWNHSQLFGYFQTGGRVMNSNRWTLML